MSDDMDSAGLNREQRQVEAKIAAAARLQQEKKRRLERAKKKFAKEGVTLRDEDIQVARVSIRMPMSAFLFGEATLVIGGGAVVDPPHVDADPTDKPRADDDPNFPSEADVTDVG